jgi:hypothetical protein
VTTTRREVDGALWKRIPDQAKQDKLVATKVTRLNRQVDLILPKNLRLADLNVVRNRVCFGKRHLERWTCRLFPDLIPVDRRAFRGVVSLDRSANHLAHEPVGLEISTYRDSNVTSNAVDFLCVPERESVIVSVGDNDCVRLERIEVIPGPLIGELVAGS